MGRPNEEDAILACPGCNEGHQDGLCCRCGGEEHPELPPPRIPAKA
jgi:hypothetical protein